MSWSTIRVINHHLPSAWVSFVCGLLFAIGRAVSSLRSGELGWLLFLVPVAFCGVLILWIAQSLASLPILRAESGIGLVASIGGYWLFTALMVLVATRVDIVSVGMNLSPSEVSGAALGVVASVAVPTFIIAVFNR